MICLFSLYLPMNKIPNNRHQGPAASAASRVNKSGFRPAKDCLLINWQRGEGGGKQRMDRDSAVTYATSCMARACDTKIKFSLWYLYFDSTWLHTAYGEFSSSIKCGYIIIGLGDSSPTSVHFLLIILLRFLDPHAFLPPSAYTLIAIHIQILIDY